MSGINVLKLTGPEDTPVTSLAYDSREVKEGTMFFALKGIHTDGHNYIEKAIASGASAIVHSDDPDVFHNNIAYIKVEDSRRAMSPLSSAFYGHPSRELKVVGVTGTDGKSSTVSMIHQLLELSGRQAGFYSTVNYKSGESIAKAAIRQSSPEAPTLHRLLREMVDNGKEFAVIESTSHGLSYRTSRLADVDFNGAVFTNVTHEHLEFHGSLEQYRSDKANLFRMAKDFAVMNRDDENCAVFDKAARAPVKLFYSTKDDSADLYATDALPDSRGTDFTLVWGGESHSVRLNVPGLINIENTLASLAAAEQISGIDRETLLKAVPLLKSVKGRMARIEGSQPFDVYVDYAHTPGSYEKVFPLFRQAAGKRLITLFGSGGERDTEKRPVQGRIADSFSDIIIITDEDPRLEDPMTIIGHIRSGIKNKREGENLFLIPDRREAIRKALELAGEGDMVITLGKGHEGSIEYADGHHPWDEITVVEELLKEMGYR